MKSVIGKLVMGMLVTFSFVRLANAAQVIVFEKSLDRPARQLSADFAVNREFGRAWIDVQIQGNDDFIGDVVPEPDVVMVRVEGLSYDSTLKQVLYRTGNETVVCAEDVFFLWFTHLRSTGNCRLKASTERRKVDDEFTVSDQSVGRIVLDVQSSSGARQATVFDDAARQQ
ncbi:MAG TPA: hypothetical protein VN797_06655 [Gemmatimonadaceae bacterium]|nr:hypothetical protein [Gemmatimonadaceae bacterium]